MPIPSPADFRDKTKKHSEVREMLAEMAENVLDKSKASEDIASKAIAVFNNDLTFSFKIAARLDSAGIEISDDNYLCTDYLKVSAGDVIHLKAATGTSKPPTICFYTEDKVFVSSATNTNHSVVETKNITVKQDGFIRCATRVVESTVKELKISLAKKTSLDESENLQEIRDSSGKLIAFIDGSGELYLPNLSNLSVQETLQLIKDGLVGLKLNSDGMSKISIDDAPAIKKLTDAQRAILELTDENGESYLNGLNNQSIQEHFNTLHERINNMLKMNTIFDAYTDFGIKTFGMTPNERSARIQAAVNFIASLPDGGTIVFREGAHLISSPIRPESKVVFKFMKGARLVPIGTSAGFTRAPSAPPSNGSIEKYLKNSAFIDVEVDGSEQSAIEYASSIKGFYIGGFSDCLWLRNRVHDTGATGIGVDFAHKSFILDSVTENCGRLAVVGNPGASGIGIGTGIMQDESLIISRNICRNNKNFGIFAEWQRLQYVLEHSRNMIVTDNICTGNYHGFGDCGLDGLIAIGNQLNDNISDGMILDTGTLPVSANRPQAGSGGLVAHNQILRNGGNGIFYDSRKVQVDGMYSWIGNNIKNNGRAGVRIEAGNKTLTDMSIAGGAIHDNAEEAVNVASGTINNFDIENVKMHRNGGESSIVINATVNTGSLTGCKIRPNSAAKAIKGSGKLTDFWINGNQYKGSSVNPVELTHSENTITYGSNAGLGV